MKQNIYIFSDSILRRKEKTLWLEKIAKTNNDDDQSEIRESYCEYLFGEELNISSGEKKAVPIESIDSILTFGTVHFNSRLIHFLSTEGIPLHLFSLTGNYGGTFMPGNRFRDGRLISLQSSFFTNHNKRMHIAKEFTEAAIHNTLQNLKYHTNRGAHLQGHIAQIEDVKQNIKQAYDVEELLGIEGTAKRIYYSAWKYIFKQPVEFLARKKNPPDNLINGLISYGNMILYSVCINEILHTRLYPEIGFIHEPGPDKLSLSFDIADIFKPLIVDRTIFKMINKNILSEKDCSVRNNRCNIKKEARQKFAGELDDRLLAKIHLDNKTVAYSMRRVIREECYKLLKHFHGEDVYSAYKSKW